MWSCRSTREPRSVLESFRWKARTCFRPISEPTSQIAAFQPLGVRMSKPAAKKWAVSRQRPRRSGFLAGQRPPPDARSYSPGRSPAQRCFRARCARATALSRRKPRPDQPDLLETREASPAPRCALGCSTRKGSPIPQNPKTPKPQNPKTPCTQCNNM